MIINKIREIITISKLSLILQETPLKKGFVWFSPKQKFEKTKSKIILYPI